VASRGESSSVAVDILTSEPTVDELLSSWQGSLGSDAIAYRNHVYRVLNLAVALSGATGRDRDKLAIAAAFHDIGIWLDATFDYLGPSILRLTSFLEAEGNAAWVPEMASIVAQHHKITPWRGAHPRLVEAFRRADWLDVSLLRLPTRVPGSYLSSLIEVFPRHGFHRRLAAIFLSWLWRHPLRPLPMLKL